MGWRQGKGIGACLGGCRLESKHGSFRRLERNLAVLAAQPTFNLHHCCVQQCMQAPAAPPGKKRRAARAGARGGAGAGMPQWRQKTRSCICWHPRRMCMAWALIPSRWAGAALLDFEGSPFGWVCAHAAEQQQASLLQSSAALVGRDQHDQPMFTPSRHLFRMRRTSGGSKNRHGRRHAQRLPPKRAASGGAASHLVRVSARAVPAVVHGRPCMALSLALGWQGWSAGGVANTW